MESSVAEWFGLSGRVALVTGAASGIGRGVAQALANAGAAVVIADRDEDGAMAVASELRREGHDATHVVVDLMREDSVRTACAEAIGWRGAPWVLVNNAGIQNRALLLETSLEFWDQNQQVNARGPFLVTREVANAMVAAGDGGRIINICSLGVATPMVPGLAAYSASKGALRTLTMTTAFELIEHGITANAVFPGGVATPGAMAATGTERSGPCLRAPPLGQCTAQDIAAAVLYLASPMAAKVTNQVISVDGGFPLT